MLDVMQWVPGISGEQAYSVLVADAVEGVAFGVPFKVSSLEHLRAMKRAAGRPQDQQDLIDLNAAP